MKGIPAPGGSSDGEFTLAVSDTGEAGGGGDEWERHRFTKQRGGRVDLGDVAQHPGLELDVGERRHRTSEAALVLGAAVDVVEHPTRQAALRDRPQVHDVRRSIELSSRTTEPETAEPNRGAQGLEHERRV